MHRGVNILREDFEKLRHCTDYCIELGTSPAVEVVATLRPRGCADMCFEFVINAVVVVVPALGPKECTD